MLPGLLLLPDEQVNERAEEMRLACTVLRLHPKALALVVDDTVEDALGVCAQRGGEKVFGNGPDGLVALDDVG